MELDWGDGSYEETARQLAPVAVAAVESARVMQGERILDVGCGTGNVALVAAQRGAEVVGIDPSERLRRQAERRAHAAGLDAIFRLGSAADPGVDAGSFDAAIAVFSIIFAPDPIAALAGVVRAVRPGGRVVITSWIPQGPIHASTDAIMEAMQPGAGRRQQSRWADPREIRALFAPHAAEVAVTEQALAIEADSPEAWFDAMERTHPFWRAAQAALRDRPNVYPRVRDHCIELLSEAVDESGRFCCTSPYLITRAELPFP